MLGGFSWSSCWVLTVFTSTVMAAVDANYQTDHDSFLGRDLCISKNNCHECIRTPQCAWCSAPIFESPRCFSPSSDNSGISTRCPEEFVQMPDNTLTIIRQAELTRANSSPINDGHSSPSTFSSSSYSSSTNRRQDTVQLSPQEVKLQLRIREPLTISFTYAPANDFPIDVYYLANFREPVENGINNVDKLGKVLAESLPNVTSNFRLGFGSTVSHSSGGTLGTTYGFQNVLSLSLGTNEFTDFVHNHTVAYNSAPLYRTGLDAILQAVVCRDQIGWRSNSRKLLILATDTLFPENNRTLAEAVQHVDELCHLDGAGFSSYSLSQNYPNITQINARARENGIHIIWAVADEQYSQFDSLTRHVEGSFARRLSNSSMTIPELIHEQYESIRTSVEMRDTASGNVKIKYSSSCLEDGAINETTRCSGLKVGNSVQFFAEIEATECPKNESEWDQRFTIYPVGIDESLTVALKMICSCDHGHPSNRVYKRQAAACHGAGTLKSGICECNDGYFGRNCECSTSGAISEHACKPDNNSFVCSRRGTCVCGACDCDKRSNQEERIYGEYCECDNFTCERHDGLLCSNHGSCECGQCICDHGWSGSACDCSTSNASCIAPGDMNNVLCSSHGDCVCGRCVCNDSGHFGIYCNESVGDFQED